MSSSVTPMMWRRSTHCSHGQCVEVATLPDSVAVRDSKNPSGPSLQFPKQAWRNFLVAAKTAEFTIQRIFLLLRAALLRARLAS
ncbi:DUF397 domain-containing protein [Cryptosporangium phraense]|uniref:DUF397 domain-containing protein n=2 Tax=Cryptosporangium phraense TaxID=2593070 RepID=A0A545AFQ3_9ACTN|nr:DUF397 domain-containing protein [Cryptosporangium phraense]